MYRTTPNNKKTQAALVVTLFETPPNENKAPPSPKGMELHHLKEIQGKLWNLKINKNNEVIYTTGALALVSDNTVNYYWTLKINIIQK